MLWISTNMKTVFLNVSGKVIRNLVNRGHIPGGYKLMINDSFLSTGIYFIKIQAWSQIEVQKTTMLE